MAKNKTKKRLRKALRKEQKRREEARRHPLGPDRGSGPNEPFTPSNHSGSSHRCTGDLSAAAARAGVSASASAERSRDMLELTGGKKRSTDYTEDTDLKDCL